MLQMVRLVQFSIPVLFSYSLTIDNILNIVVLIILAAVAINLSLGENGIFNRAKTATQEYQNAQDYEETQIAKYSNKIDSYVNGNRDYESEIKSLKEEIQRLKAANSYSTDEQVIGTWTDGKPLYRKIVEGLSFTPASNTWVDSPVVITDLKRVVKVRTQSRKWFFIQFFGI